MLAASYALPLAVLFTEQVVRWCVWGGLVGLTVALLVMVRTSWGHSQPLRKCIALSLLAHLLLGIYMTTINIVINNGGSPDGQSLRVSYLDDGSDANDASAKDSANGVANDLTARQAWEAAIPGPPAEPANKATDTASVPAELKAKEPVEEPPQKAPEDSKPPVEPPTASVPSAVEITPPAADVVPKPAVSQAEPIDAPPHEEPKNADIGPPETVPVETAIAPEKTPEHAEVATTTPAASTATLPESGGASAGNPQPDNATASSASAANDLPLKKVTRATPTGVPALMASSSAGATGSGSSTATTHEVPSMYRLRVAGDRSQILKGNGGNPETEAAVRAALKWLAATQSADGRWDPRRFGGGREVMIDGQDRRGAGAQADTGITGLSLLAFLAAGHTHVQGEGQDTVRRGLEYLMSVQAQNGNLSGRAAMFEKMYCHAMATFAMSEAYAMTGDDRLQTAVRRAIAYTVAAQQPASGGWRYQPGEPGDTSQLGWQLMALKSAELAGIKMPDDTRAGMLRFLKSVSAGRQGGLACYRPGHPVSRPMTAEALVCRQFLGMPRENPASDEAGNYLLQELPGSGPANLYYWYYGTLGMYQLQGEHWQRWNEALQASLLRTQRTGGDLAGSWDPDATWGAYGGRSYSTALSALCLEVYYRFLPLYVEAAGREHSTK